MTEFERGRTAGINEAVARLALWRAGYDEHGEPVPWADYAIKIVTALLPPVAPSGDRATKQLLRELRRMAKQIGAVLVVDRAKLERFERAYGRKAGRPKSESDHA